MLGVPGKTHGRAAVVAVAGMLRPLATGAHSLVISSTTRTTTYQLSVG